jgi:lipopolysaccharide export system protein LptA
MASTAMGILLQLPGPAAGQTALVCEVPSNQGFLSVALSDGSRIIYFSSPTFACPGGMVISADSAVVFEASSYSQLFGNVKFRDEETRLAADTAHYFAEAERLNAYGSVVLNNDVEGSVIRGDTMVLLRANDQRELDRLTVTGSRPHATLYPARQADTASVPADTAATPADTVAAPPDTVLIAPDTTTAVPDTSAVLPDTTEAPPDTLIVLPDTAVTVPPDTSGALQPPEPVNPEAERTPYEIDADTIFLEGSQYFKARGSVRITRDSLNASADSVEYDELEGALSLGGAARLLTSDYDLSGRSIVMEMVQDDVRGVVAREEAVLEGEDLRLLAPIITLALLDGEVQELVAVRDPVADSLAALADSLAEMSDAPEATPSLPVLPPSANPVLEELELEAFPMRPYALAQDFLLQSDSMEVLVPEDVLEEVWAIGNARGESLGGDSLNAVDTPESFRRDWLEGDTIIASFGTGEAVPMDPADSLAMVLDTLSLLEPPARDPEDPDPPLPDTTTVEETADQEYRLERLVARGNAKSFYRLAPSSDTTTASDTTAAPDTAVASDTTASGAETGPSFHYVIGDEITILLSQGEVEKMEVSGRTRGIHLEPVIRRGSQGGQARGVAGSQPARRSPGPGGGP